MLKAYQLFKFYIKSLYCSADQKQAASYSEAVWSESAL